MELRVITKDDVLWRHLRKDHLKPDGTIASTAYMVNNQPDPQLSVDIADMTSFADARMYRDGHTGPGLGIGELVAAVPFELGFPAVHNPILDRNPPYLAHSLILGGPELPEARKLARATCLRLHPLVPL